MIMYNILKNTNKKTYTKQCHRLVRTDEHSVGVFRVLSIAINIYQIYIYMYTTHVCLKYMIDERQANVHIRSGNEVDLRVNASDASATHKL